MINSLQLSEDVLAVLVPHRSGITKIQYTRLSAKTGAVRVCFYRTRGYPHLFALVTRFQKAIKKVRAVQRMRRTRGFAFSQTETAGKQDQARLIRAYDTSKSNARPTGY